MEDPATTNAQDPKATPRNQPTADQSQSVAATTPITALLTTPLSWASPFSLMRVFMDDLDRLVEGFASMGNSPATAPVQRANQAWTPAVEVFERDDHFVIRAEVPGLDREHITVEIDDGQVILSGERVEEQEQRTSAYYRRERRYGRFYRVVPLPDGADASQAAASFNHGVLEISMPVRHRVEARKLEIQEGGNGSDTKSEASTP